MNFARSGYRRTQVEKARDLERRERLQEFFANRRRHPETAGSRARLLAVQQGCPPTPSLPHRRRPRTTAIGPPPSITSPQKAGHNGGEIQDGSTSQRLVSTQVSTWVSITLVKYCRYP